MDPAAIARALGESVGMQTAPGNDELASRANFSRMVFAATLEAYRGTCDCRPCVLMRALAESMMPDTKVEVKSAGQGNDPQPPANDAPA